MYNVSVSSKVVELLRTMDDTPFASSQITQIIQPGADHLGAVSGCLSNLYKDGILGREISQEWRGYKWWVADRQALNAYKFRLTPSGGGDGSRKNKLPRIAIPEKPPVPLHERLWELAIELSEGKVDLSQVPMEELVAELSRRMPK